MLCILAASLAYSCLRRRRGDLSSGIAHRIHVTGRYLPRFAYTQGKCRTICLCIHLHHWAKNRLRSTPIDGCTTTMAAPHHCPNTTPRRARPRPAQPSCRAHDNLTSISPGASHSPPLLVTNLHHAVPFPPPRLPTPSPFSPRQSGAAAAAAAAAATAAPPPAGAPAAPTN